MISKCCYAKNRIFRDKTYLDYGICPACQDNCEFIEEKTVPVKDRILFYKTREYELDQIGIC